MDLKNHCLFCLEQIVPYIVPSINSRNNRCGVVAGDVGKETMPPDFQSLCTYLKISMRKMGSEKLALSCDKLLCISCFEMVEQLSKLHREMMEIRKRIGEASGRIRGVILAHDISGDLSSSSRMRLEFEKKLGSGGMRRSRDIGCLEFVEMFQTEVKGLHFLEGRAIGQDSRKEVSDSDKSINENNVELDEVEMKIELDEGDLDNCKGEGEGDFQLYTNTHCDIMCSPIESQEEIDDHPFNASVLECESENKDEEDMKPDITTQLTTKKKNKGLRWQSPIGSSSISCRTRKRLRESFPEPSIKSSPPTKEEKPKPQFKCPDCDLSFTSYSKRYEHRRKFHPPKLSTLQRLAALIQQVPRIRIPGARNRKQNRKYTYICNICGLHVNEVGSTKLLNYMEHMLSHDDESTSEETGLYSCTECDKQFNLKINLDLHVACIHDTRQQVIQCILCRENINYGTRQELIDHLKSAHGDTVYSCKHCPMSFISFEKLLLHMRKHTACKKLLCPECIAVCTTMQDLHEHCLEVHPQLKKTHNCERCGNVYMELNRLRFHMEIEHGFDRKSNTFKEKLYPGSTFTCPHCNSKGKVRMYKTELALQKHIYSSHNKEKNHKCNQCEDVSFVSKSALRIHVEKFHDKLRFPCHICSQSYSDRSTLNAHLKTHTGEGLLICEICSKEYQNMSLLRRHMGTTHATVQNSKHIACEECGKEFLGEFKLRRHKQKLHPKVKRVSPKCPICERAFSTPYNLKNHMKRHSGQIKCKCPICKKCLSDKSVLKTHLKGVHGKTSAEAEEILKQGAEQLD